MDVALRDRFLYIPIDVQLDDVVASASMAVLICFCSVVFLVVFLFFVFAVSFEHDRIVCTAERARVDGTAAGVRIVFFFKSF